MTGTERALAMTKSRKVDPRAPLAMTGTERALAMTKCGKLTKTRKHIYLYRFRVLMWNHILT